MNYSYEDIKVVEATALIAYCDVTGFTAWVRRAAVKRADVTVFIKKMKWIFREFRMDTGYTCIPIGDGIIALVVDVEDGYATELMPLLKAVSTLQRKMMDLIGRTNHPRPAGFRIRVTSGAVFRTEEPPMDGQTFWTFDVLGDPMNAGSRLLEVRREVPAMITLSALSLLSKDERDQLEVLPVKIDSERPPRGLEREDLEELSEFRFKLEAA